MTACKVHTGNWREKCLTCIWWLKYKPSYWESWKPQLQSRKASQCLPEIPDSSQTARRAALDRILSKSYQMSLRSPSICSLCTATRSLLWLQPHTGQPHTLRCCWCVFLQCCILFPLWLFSQPSVAYVFRAEVLSLL